ncbi:MAG: DUF4129 domain-containing protein [Inhella sp.]
MRFSGLLLALVCGLSSAEPAPPATSASAVRAAASSAAAHPLMPGTETTKTLRFKNDQHTKKTEKPQPPSPWWVGLMENLTGGLRVAVWLVGAGLFVWVLLRLRDWLQARRGGAALAPLAPTHVGSLDIRPESLPTDVGAAAWLLWQRGEARAALSLLYRGALSRLVHGHGVPIRAASTERECLALAAPRLGASAQVFLRQLVSSWQAVAYAQRPVESAQMEALCQGFALHLPDDPRP